MRIENVNKEHYEVPKIEIYEVINEGLICASSQQTTSAPDFIMGKTYGNGQNVWEE